MVCYSHLFKIFLRLVGCHDSHKGFIIVNEAEVDVFLEFPCFLFDSTNVSNLISGSSAFSEPKLYVWKFLVHILPKSCLKDFKHNLTSMWDEHNCVIVWTFFGIGFLWDWNENWPFPVQWSLLSFPNLLTYWMQHFKNIWLFNLDLILFQMKLRMLL